MSKNPMLMPPRQNDATCEFIDGRMVVKTDAEETIIRIDSIDFVARLHDAKEQRVISKIAFGSGAVLVYFGDAVFNVWSELYRIAVK